MKNFFKKLAFVMALAMVITSLAPAAGVFAAAKPALNAKSKTLLLGNKGRNTFDFNLNNKVKGSTYKWTTSNKKVVTVAQNGIVKAVANGKATIKLAIKLPTGKTTNLTAAVVVKTNATSVEITNLPEGAIKVGATVNLNRSYKTLTGTKTTDVTSFVITGDNAAKATIKANGKFTATEAGEYTIKAVMAQSASKLKAGVYTAESADVKVVVEPSIVSIAQTSATKFVVTFDADMSKLVTKDNLTITANGVKLPYVKEVKFDATGKIATVETYVGLSDKVVYTVSSDKMSKDFVASVGAVAKIAITGPSVIAYNTAEKLTVKFFDANGVEVNGNESNISLKVLNSIGWVDKQKLTLFNIGDVATVQATYKTGTYDANWNEIVLTSPEFVVTAAETTAANVTTLSSWTIAAENQADFAKPVQSLPLNVSDNFLYIKGVNSANTDVTTGFKFESVDSSKLIVNQTTGKLIPVATGTVGVIVSNGTFKSVITVTVTPAESVAKIAFDKNTTTVSSTINETAVFNLTAQNQYGNVNTTTSEKAKVTSLSKPSTVLTEKEATDLLGDVTFASGKAVATFTSVKDTTKDGTYVYRVALGDVTTVLQITVKSGVVADVSSYRVSLVENTFDTVVNKDSDGNKIVAVKVYGYDNKGTAVVDVTSGAVLTLTHTTDADVKTVSVTGGAITLNSKTVTGVYAVSGTYKDIKNVENSLVTAAYTVKNSQDKAIVTKNVAEFTTVANKAALIDELNLNGFKVTSKFTGTTPTYKIVESTLLTGLENGVNAAGKYDVVVKKVEVTEKFGTNQVVYTVDVNANFVVTIK